MSVPVKKCALVGSLAASLLAVSGAGPGSDADAQDRYNRWVRIHNNTSLVLREFYASNTGEPRWQEDILGYDVLYPGRSVDVLVDDGTGHCRYDFKAVFENGSQAIDWRINVCEVRHFTYR